MKVLVLILRCWSLWG